MNLKFDAYWKKAIGEDIITSQAYKDFYCQWKELSPIGQRHKHDVFLDKCFLSKNQNSFTINCHAFIRVLVNAIAQEKKRWWEKLHTHKLKERISDRAPYPLVEQ